MMAAQYGVTVSITEENGDATVLPIFRVTFPEWELNMYGPEIAARRALSVVFPLINKIAGVKTISVYTWPDDGERVEGRCGVVKWDSTNRESVYTVE